MVIELEKVHQRNLQTLKEEQKIGDEHLRKKEEKLKADLEEMTKEAKNKIQMIDESIENLKVVTDGPPEKTVAKVPEAVTPDMVVDQDMATLLKALPQTAGVTAQQTEAIIYAYRTYMSQLTQSKKEKIEQEKKAAAEEIGGEESTKAASSAGGAAAASTTTQAEKPPEEKPDEEMGEASRTANKKRPAANDSEKPDAKVLVVEEEQEDDV